jgi:hypothetical protein
MIYDALIQYDASNTTYDGKTLNIDKTFTNDGIVKVLNNDKAFIEDAIVKVLDNSKTFTTDAIVKVLNSVQTFTNDGVLKTLNIDKTFTEDGVIKVFNNDKDFINDGVVKILDNESTFTEDGLVRETFDGIFTNDGIVRDTFIQIFTEDGIIEVFNTDKNFTNDGVIKVLDNLTIFTEDGLIRETFVKTFTNDAIVKILNIVKTFTNNGYVQEIGDSAIDTDGLIRETFDITIDEDGLVRETLDKNFIEDGLVRDTLIETFIEDGLIRDTFITTFTQDCLVRDTFELDLTEDGVIKTLDNNSSFTNGGLIQDTFDNFFTDDGLVSGLIEFTIDGIIFGTLDLDFTNDGRVKEIQSQIFGNDGIVKTFDNNSDFTEDGVVKVFDNNLTFTENALLKIVNIDETFTTDAIVKATSTINFFNNGIVFDANVITGSFHNKSFYYKILKSNGTYITTWSSEVVNDPTFKSVINGGLSELIIKLAREFNSIDEDDSNRDINFRNEIQLWIQDLEEPNGLLIYDGFISDYSPYLDGNDEYINVTCLGYVDDLSSSELIDSNHNTAITYPSSLHPQTDPGDIIKNILILSAGKITGTSTVFNTGTSVNYTFNNSTVKDAIDKAKDMSLADWYWFVGVDNKLHFQESNVTVDHTLFIERDILKIDTYKTIRDLKNEVRFIGGYTNPLDPTDTTQLYKVYQDSASIALYGKRSHTIVDTKVIVETTANAQANKFLEEHKDPFVRSTIEVIDSNGDQTRGYDIESLKPGDTVQIIDPRMPSDSQVYSFSQPFIIQTVTYEFDKATIELSVRPPWIALALQRQINALSQDQNSNIPTHPIGTGVDDLSTIVNTQVYGADNQPGQLVVLNGKLTVTDSGGTTTISGGKVTTSGVDFVVVGSNNIVATINASIEGITIAANKITISGSTTFTSGYDPSTKVAALAGTYSSATIGPKVQIFPDANTGIVINNGTNDVFVSKVGGVDVGDVIIGNYSTGQGIKYDSSANTTTFQGAIAAATVSSGSIVIDTNGNIRSGQTAYNTGTGFWFGSVSSIPKFSIGNSAGNRITWDGSTLNVVGYIATNGALVDVQNNASDLSTIRPGLGNITSGTFKVSTSIAIQKSTSVAVGYIGQDPGATGIWGFIAERGYGLMCRYSGNNYFRIFVDSGGSNDAIIDLPSPNMLKIQDNDGSAIARFYGSNAGFTNQGGLDMIGSLRLFTTNTPPTGASNGILFYHTTWNEVWAYLNGAWHAFADKDWVTANFVHK